MPYIQYPNPVPLASTPANFFSMNSVFSNKAPICNKPQPKRNVRKT